LQTPSIRTLALLACLAAALRALPTAGAAPPESHNSASDEMPPPAEGAVKEVQPPVLLLRNKDGNLLQAVLGFTLEDFGRFMSQRAQSGLGQQPPRYQLDRLTCRARAEDRQVDLTIEISAVVNQSGWVRIPLRLGEAILRSKPRYQGPGEHRIEFDTALREHVLWLRGESDEPRLITIDCAVPLERVGDQMEMRLGFPRTAVSEMTLTVADAMATAVVREGGILDDTKHLKDETQFRTIGMDPNFAIAWQREGGQATDASTPVEATGAIESYIDGSGVHSDVQLTAHSFRAKMDAFRLRLPAGTTLTATEQPGYSIEPVDGAAPAAASERLYEVRLREKTAGPVLVRFSTDRPHTFAEKRAFEIVGVELLGAARQSGFVAIRLADGWQIDWGDLRQARQVDELPPEFGHEDLLAGFEYFGAPFSIAGRLAPRRTHLSVEPRYRVEIDAQRLRLEGRLKYQVRGAKAFALEVALPGWELDDIAPRGTFDVDRVSVDTGNPLRVPLLQPSTGEIELVLQAHRDLPADTTRVEFLLPQPVADTASPAQLVVVPAGNAAVAVREAELSGLTRAPAAEGAALDKHRQELEFRGQGEEMRFAADLSLASPRVSAQVQTLVNLDEHGGKVRQVIRFTAPKDQAGELLIDVPAWLDGAQQVDWQLEGQSIVPIQAGGEANLERTTRFRLPHVESSSRARELVVQFPLRSEPLVAGKGVPVDVPLVMPAGASIQGNELTVLSGAGIEVQPRDETWNVEPTTAAGADRAALKLSSTVATCELALEVRLEDRRLFDPAVVERAWIQTRLAGGARWDRAVYQFTGGEKQISLRLPPSAVAAEARAQLDGIAVAPQLPQRDTLSFELPAAGRRHVLDVSYRFAPRSDQRGRLVLAAPVLGDGDWVRQMYWQLVLPRSEHLVDWPAAMTGVFEWRFQNGFWGRQPVVEQARLEAWADATHGAEVPQQTNRYVLSSLGQVDQLEIYTASRMTLVLAGAGGVLAVGLLLLYLPVLRHPALLFIVGVSLLAGAMLFPEPTVLIAQLAAVGAVLAVMAVMLERFLQSRRRSPLVMRTGPSSIVDPGSTKAHLRPQPSAAGNEPVALIPQATASHGES
jgi:hypothetical protein